MGVMFQNATPRVAIRFIPNFSEFLVIILTKFAYRSFEISSLTFFKKIEFFVGMG